MKFFNNIVISLIMTIGLTFSVSSFATTVQFETNMGNFEVELFDEATPKSVANFLQYVNAKAYDGSIIHRSIKDFVIQGGGFQYKGEVPLPAILANDPVINEPGKSNLRGTIAYAKKANDPNSATTGWFINLADNSGNLDTQNEGFTVFGKVIGDGMTVIDKIATLDTFKYDGAFANIPLRNFTTENFKARNTPNDTNFVIITSVRVIDSNTNTDSDINTDTDSDIDTDTNTDTNTDKETDKKKKSGGGSMELFFILLLLSAFILKRYSAPTAVKIRIKK